MFTREVPAALRPKPREQYQYVLSPSADPPPLLHLFIQLTLAIRPARVKDVGKYQVSLSNALGQADSAADVRVKKTYQAPHFAQKIFDLQQVTVVIDLQRHRWDAGRRHVTIGVDLRPSRAFRRPSWVRGGTSRGSIE